MPRAPDVEESSPVAALGTITLLIAFMVAAYAGLALQTKLTSEHKSGETKGVVGQVSRVVGGTADAAILPVTDIQTCINFSMD